LTAIFHHLYSADQLFVIFIVVQHVSVVNVQVSSCHYYRLRLMPLHVPYNSPLLYCTFKRRQRSYRQCHFTDAVKTAPHLRAQL